MIATTTLNVLMPALLLEFEVNSFWIYVKPPSRLWNGLSTFGMLLMASAIIETEVPLGRPIALYPSSL
jgi:hypothetical protein